MKKNVASQVVGCQLISKTDGSAVTSSTTTVYVTGDGGTQATGSVGSGACTHEGHGYWTYAPAQAETNYDQVAFTFENTNACNVTVQIYPSFPQTGDGFARLGAPAGASVSADIAAVKSQTAAIETDTGTDIPATLATIAGYIDTEVGAIYSRIGAPVGASISADIAAVQADTDNIQTRIPAALVSGRIDASVGAMAANTLTASALATDAVNEIADGVWDEATSGHTTAGTTGKALTDAGSAGDPWSTLLPGAYGAGTAGKIIGDNVNATIGSRATQTSVDTIDDFVDTEVAAIKAKTDNLPSDPADASDIAASFSTVNSTLSTMSGYIDTEIAAIKAKTDSLTFTVAGQVDANVQYVNDVQVTGNGQLGTEWGPA